MRVLFATGSPPSYMAPPRLATEQINCGPDWPDANSGGRIVSMATPAGPFDIAAMVNRLPGDQKPDVVVCLVDAVRRICPVNLKAVRCPKVLLLADTHHCDSPLTNLARYATAESYDRVVILYDRHHVDLLRAAGVKNLFWFPGLTFPHDDQAVRSVRNQVRSPTIAFVGQRGRHHPRRVKLLDALSEAQLPLDVRAVGQAEALRVYGGALVGFNASLNGDFNVRAFEVLSAGGMLLTDRLAPMAGMADTWQDGTHVLTYGDPRELVARARNCLENPERTREIAIAGSTWFDSHFSQAARQKAFAALAMDGVAHPLFALPRISAAATPAADRSKIAGVLAIYEAVQELHRTEEQVTIAMDSACAADFQEAFATLPRLNLVPLDAAKGAEGDVLILPRSRLGPLQKLRARLVCVPAVAGVDTLTLDREMAARGYARTHRTFAIYRAEPPASGSASAAGRRAFDLLEAGQYAAAVEVAQSLLQRDSTSVEAMLVMGEVALDMGNRELALRMLAGARRSAPGDARVITLQREFAVPNRTRKLPTRLLTGAQAALREQKWEAALALGTAALRADSGLRGVHSVLGDALVGCGKPLEAMAEFQAALRESPGDDSLAERVQRAQAACACAAAADTGAA